MDPEAEISELTVNI